MQRSFIVCTVMFLLCVFSAIAQDKKAVSGTVLDETGGPLIGVSVQEKGTTNGTLTQDGGKFTLKVAPGATLVFSYIGYLKQESPAAEGVSVKLTPDTKGLNEVVVTALGIKRESRALGYAVSTVSAKDLTQTGATNFASALYGKAAGVKVVSAPGGASSGVSVQVRGVSSIGLSTQPLYVVDGVPIRNYSDLTTGQYNVNGNNRIEGNGALDINPEDIETLTVLKGAAASALYGSEATNGVIVITTKKGYKQKGLGVEASYLFNTERVANNPDYQNEYGPGYDSQTENVAFKANADGFIPQKDGTYTPHYSSWANFGPKFDGRDVKYWDGTTRKYSANKNNYKDFFDKGYNSVANVAISNASEQGNYRLSYTRTDYKGVMPGMKLNKNNFNFNGTLKLSNRVSVDLVSTFNNNFTHNRPTTLGTVLNSYGGFFSRMDDMKTIRARSITKAGYKYTPYGGQDYAPGEMLLYPFNGTQLMDYYYGALHDSYNENQNRFINSATLNYSILDNLKFRARVGNDYTGFQLQDQEHNQKPTSFGNSGKYLIETRINNTVYGDGLLTYSPKIGKDFDMNISGGVEGRRQRYSDATNQTTTGLAAENYFSLKNSVGIVATDAARAEQIDVAAFGMISASFRNYLFAEVTGREESTSTLPPGQNKYFYPSVDAGFVLSDAVKLPSIFDYAKVRGSYGLVGNHPNLYQAAVQYVLASYTYGGNSILYNQSNGSGFGNDGLKSEQKREGEVGVEARMFKSRFGFDLSYYQNKVNRQILNISTPASTGSTSQLVNAGDIENHGFEAALNGTIIQGKNFNWTSRLNFAINRNKVTALAPGLPYLIPPGASLDNGYVQIRAAVGEALGDIYVHPLQKDAKGNLLVDGLGLYNPDPDLTKYEKAGSIMPKIVGGFSNTFSYKQFALDVTLDYRFGGQFISTPRYYQMGAGQFNETLQYRDAGHGGQAITVVDEAAANYKLDPNGTRHDGLVLPGVKADGTPNDKVITAGIYYENKYDWTTNGDYHGAIFDNSYIKVRELALTYSMPQRISDKLHMNSLQFALIGRNLFYIYKTLPQGLDPETGTGSSWLTQGIDQGTAAPTRSFGASIRARF